MGEITKELIEKRLAELKLSAEQLKANLSATVGAIQDCEYWLSVLEAEKVEQK